MIKINLLNSYKQLTNVESEGGAFLAGDQEGDERKIVTDFVKNIVLASIGPLGLFYYELQNISSLQEKYNEISVRFNELKNFNDSKTGLAEEIKKYVDQQSRFVAQADFITKIDADKVNEYQLFQHLKNLTPQSVWIEKLELNNNSLMIRAQSDVGTEIDSFVQKLSSAEVISSLAVLNRSTKSGFAETDIEITTVNIKAQISEAKSSDGDSK